MFDQARTWHLPWRMTMDGSNCTKGNALRVISNWLSYYSIHYMLGHSSQLIKTGWAIWTEKLSAFLCDHSSLHYDHQNPMGKILSCYGIYIFNVHACRWSPRGVTFVIGDVWIVPSGCQMLNIQELNPFKCWSDPYGITARRKEGEKRWILNVLTDSMHCWSLLKISCQLVLFECISRHCFQFECMYRY